MYIMHTTHFHIKQWQFLFLMLLRFAQKKPACVLLSKHLQYKYTRNSKTINKLTINLFAHLHTIDIEKFHLQYSICFKLELYI